MIMKVVTIHTKVSIRATCCSPGWTMILYTHRRCLEVAQSGGDRCVEEGPLLTEKRTSNVRRLGSAFTQSRNWQTVVPWRGGRAPRGFSGFRLCENRSFHRLQQLPRFTQQGLNLLAPGDRVPREQAVPAHVLVCPWCAGSRRTAVHAAAPFAAHRRRAARSAAADFCAATRARQHRTDIAGAISHAFAPRLASRELCKQSCSCAPRSGVETIRASVTAGAG